MFGIEDPITIFIILMMPIMLLATIFLVWMTWHHEKRLKEGKVDYFALRFNKNI